MFVHQVTVAFLRKRFKSFDVLRRNEKSNIIYGLTNFNLDFWLTMPPMVISLSLSIEDNLRLFLGYLIFGCTLIAISLILDGQKGCIV
jgi:hypothetical protein